MTIWLKVWASDEHDTVHFAVVDATPGRVNRWLRRMDIVGELKRSLDNVHSVEFEGEPIVFHERAEELDTLMDDIYAEEVIVIRRPIRLLACSIVPQEITRLVIMPDDIFWRSYRESTGTILITAVIPRMLLELLASSDG